MSKKQGRSDTVEFHEYGRTYYWHIPSGRVTNVKGLVVCTGCHNLNVARSKVRGQHK